MTTGKKHDARVFAEQRRAAAFETVKGFAEFDISRLMREVELPQGTAQSYITHWIDQGQIVVVRKEGNRKFFQSSERREEMLKVAQGGGAPATPEGNMWRAMRMLPVFTPLDLSAHANAGGVTVSVLTAINYCKQLQRIGYLRVRVANPREKRKVVYQLMRNSGPKPPSIESVKGVVDRNLGEFIPLDEEHLR